MEDRRKQRTPFSFDRNGNGYWLKDSSGQHLGIVNSEQHAIFICKSCNRYDILMKAANLCRAELEDYTLPLRTPGRKALAEIFELLKD